MKRNELILVVVILLLGTALRVHRAYGPPLWVDEAESTINALTILDHGVPVDTYMGLPIFENVLIREWPGHEELAFKDVSYSDRGLAIYHGWLPLYSIATACWFADITPDAPPATLRVQHEESTYRVRSFVPRIPAILSSVIFLVMLFAFARTMLGPEAGIPVLVTGAFLDRMVYFSIQARYYSLTLLFSVLCAYAIWNVANHRRWRDHVLLGVAFVLLFHTHTISFLILSGAGTLMLPWIVREPRDVARLTTASVIVLSGTLPWLFLTGFLDSTAGIPRAWTQVAPMFALSYPSTKKAFLIPAALGLGWLITAEIFDKRLPARLVTPFTEKTLAFYFLAGWAAISYSAFTLLIPAASYFPVRVTLVVALPGILLTVAVATAAARVVSKTHAALVATAILIVLMVGSNRITIRGVEAGEGRFLMYDLIRVLRDIEFRPGTKLYASPNNHLLLTYYAGLPVQSVAPIRKSFFDTYPNDIVIFETIGRNGPMIDHDAAIELGAQHYAPVHEQNVQLWIDGMDIWNTVETLQSRIATVNPSRITNPNLIDALMLAQRAETQEGLREHQREIPMLQGDTMDSWADWWTRFFYRFVEIDEHTGPNLNFGDRMRDGTATVLPNSWVVYESTPTGPPYLDMRKAYRTYERPELLTFFNPR